MDLENKNEEELEFGEHFCIFLEGTVPYVPGFLYCYELTIEGFLMEVLFEKREG